MVRAVLGHAAILLKGRRQREIEQVAAGVVIREHSTADLDEAAIDRTIDMPNASFPERILRTFRAAIAGIGNPDAQVQTIPRISRDVALQPYESLEPVPVIIDDDVYLVCWIAITADSALNAEPDSA